jgi:hypothetical protein
MKALAISFVSVFLALGALGATIVNVGEAGTYNGSNSFPSPYGNFYDTGHEQYLVTAAELAAAGATPGNITSLAFNVHAVNGCQALPQFRIKLGLSALTQLGTSWVEGLTTVSYANPYQPVAGWNTHTFDTPFYWNGSSSLVVDAGYRQTTLPSANASVYHTTTSPHYRAIYFLNGAGIQQAYERPNLRLELEQSWIQIGSGTVAQNMPVNPEYSYSYSQCLYRQSEINTAGQQITRLAYEWSGVADAPNCRSWNIYMGHTPLTYFSGTNDWIPLAQMTQVFSGNVYMSSDPGWVEIILDTPFPYDNVNSLVIAVDENTPGWDVTHGNFLNTYTGAGYQQLRSLEFHSDTVNPDPGSPPVTPFMMPYYPNTRLWLQIPGTGAPQAPILVYPENQATGLPIGGFDLSWAPNAGGGRPDSYTLYLADDPDQIYAQHIWPGLTATSYNPVSDGGLSFQYGEVWYWTVRAVNASGTAVASPPSRFGIEADPALAIPCLESFDGSSWPDGWTQAHSYPLTGDVWSVSETGNAGGSPCEMHASDRNEVGGTRLISPAISTNGLSAFLVSFKHYFEDYDAGLTARLQYSHDLSTWFNTGWSLASGNGDASGTVTALIHGISAPYTYVAWTLEGDHFMMNGWYVDDVLFGNALGHDVAVVSIGNVPEVASPDAVFASAVIANYGTNAESFEVFMRSGARFTDTQAVSNLAPGASVEISFDPFLPQEDCINEIQVITLLGTDQNILNDQQTQLFACVDLEVEGLLNVAYDLTAIPDGPASFSLSRPSHLTALPGTPLNISDVWGSDWINNSWYAMEYDYGTLEYDNLWEIDPLTGAMDLLGQTGMGYLTGLTQNPTAGTIYACNGTQLFTLDLQTGAASPVGPFNFGSDFMVCLAYDQSHDILYGISGWEPSLYTINPGTGAATLVGGLGLDSVEPRDCAFDQDNGHLFLTGWFNESFLYWIDTDTGLAWKVGDFPEGTAMNGFAIPFGPPETPVAVIQSGGTLTWDAVYRADGYKIYGAAEPDGAFTLLGSTVNTAWTDPAFPQQKRFYRVTAVRN